ncbi:DUF6522 family protein [Marivita sp. S0852]|uniref:DUF6522 family protein n=1 Tax=Marivita sp. S0852 TaxID=3373893 RepID=UPI003981B765
MSDTTTRRRIRAQASVRDANVMGFTLDTDVQPGRTARFDEAGDTPLSRALFAIPYVTRVEISGPTIWVKKSENGDWAILKPGIAAAIRAVLDETDTPLGRDADVQDAGPDDALRHSVEGLLDRQVNPAVAAHGGHISVDRVKDGTVYLRMSGGCQGCAASSATLRQGVERMLRAALPQIEEIVDVTDHAAGSDPFYARADDVSGRASPVLNRPIPESVIGWEDGQIVVDPDYLAPRLNLTVDRLRAGLRNGDVVAETDTVEGAHAGKTRIVLRSGTRAWAAEIAEDGTAREVPPPRQTDIDAKPETDLPHRVRTYLEDLGSDHAPITYGTLARGLGLWMPGSVGKVTRALETTMREDAAAGRPFIAARVVSRGRKDLPAQGFFDLARTLSRGPDPNETETEYHARELRLLRENEDASPVKQRA